MIIIINGYSKEQEGYFFPEHAVPLYKTSFSDNNVELRISKIKTFEEGILYELKLEYQEELIDRYGADLLNLGYFYVQNDKIYLIQDMDSFDELVTADDMIASGTLVCQEEEKEDVLEEEKGWHEYILVDGNRREYHGYNSLTETGYYQHFIWEKGSGLIEYRRGYGAAGDSIELHLLKEMKDD